MKKLIRNFDGSIVNILEKGKTLGVIIAEFCMVTPNYDYLFQMQSDVIYHNYVETRHIFGPPINGCTFFK